MRGALLALGASHKTAPVAVRERLALPEGRAARVLAELISHEHIQEAVAISTCNRTEIYLVGTDPVEAESGALAALARQAEIPPTELFGHVYSFRGDDAVRHLFSVTAGLDSMIVGEAEVQGQVKRAYELALVEGVTGPVTNRLFRDALSAGKRVRTETGTGRSRLSLAGVAVDVAERVLGSLEDRQVLVIGAGENGERTASALREHGVGAVFVANRRFDRARALAERFQGLAVHFEDLPERLVETDIVVTSTGSPHQILERDGMAQIAEAREGRPLLLVDIAVPRDIAPGVRDLPGIKLIDMDDLQREIARNLNARQAETGRAAAVIEEEAERFGDWLASLDVVPAIAALRERAERVVQAVLAENEGRWEDLSDADRARVGVLAQAVAGRLLHEPTLRLRRSVTDDDAYVYIQAVRELFGLDAPSSGGGTGTGAEIASLEDHRRARPRG